MKYITALLFLIAPVMGMGQKKDTSATAVLTGNLTIGTTTLTISSETIRPPRYDTTRCVMLMCDTAIRITGNDYGLFPNPVGWKIGYEVLKYSEYWELVGYLDEDKHPLRKSIIVWQAKTR